LGSSKKTMKIGFLILVIFLSSFHNQIDIQGREKPEYDSPDLNNLVVVSPPNDFYIRNNRFYFKLNKVVYRYNIEDKQNIYFMNHLQVDGVYSTYIQFFDDKLITLDCIYKEVRDFSRLKISFYNIDNDEEFEIISSKETKVPIRIGNAKILSENLILLKQYSGGGINPDYDKYYLFSIDSLSLIKLPGGIATVEDLYMWPKTAELIENYLYLVTTNHQYHSYYLLTFDVSDLNQPILLCNVTINYGIGNFANSKRINDRIYIESVECGILNAFNITNRIQPTIIGNFTLSERNAMRANEKYAIAIGREEVNFYNISNFNNITFIRTFNNFTQHFYQYNSRVCQNLMILTNFASFILFDISNITNIINLGIIEPPYHSLGLKQELFIPVLIFVFFYLRKRKKRKLKV